MPSALLETVLEEMYNPAYDIDVETSCKPVKRAKMGRPRILSEDQSVIKVRMGYDQIAELDRKRGSKTRSEFIRDLIDEA